LISFFFSSRFNTGKEVGTVRVDLFPYPLSLRKTESGTISYRSLFLFSAFV